MIWSDFAVDMLLHASFNGSCARRQWIFDAANWIKRGVIRYRFNVSRNKILSVSIPRVKNISVIYDTIRARGREFDIPG